MSTRVFNPYVMSGKRGGGHLDFGDGGQRSPRDYASIERAKRKLFGPVDHAEAKAFAERELAAIREEASKKWNFDFKTGKPRPPEDPDSGYKWVKLSPDEEIPKAYALTGCDYLHTHADLSGDADFEMPSSSTAELETAASKQCNKQSMITDFMKATKRRATKAMAAKGKATSTKGSAKTEPMPSGSQDEPDSKKARAKSS